jgi:transposase
MQRPQEIEVAEEHEIVERVAAIDVAKATGTVCTRVPHASATGKRVTRVWEVRATTKGITELAEHLVNERIERVVLESTSDYWRPFLSAPRGALTYPPRSGEGLEVTSLGPMAYLVSKE